MHCSCKMRRRRRQTHVASEEHGSFSLTNLKRMNTCNAMLNLTILLQESWKIVYLEFPCRSETSSSRHLLNSLSFFIIHNDAERRRRKKVRSFNRNSDISCLGEHAAAAALGVLCLMSNKVYFQLSNAQE